MVSPHGRRCGYSQEPYHFFKLILQSTIRDAKLVFPRKFARDYGNTLSSPVIFEVPNGQVWDLELKNLDGKLWVQDGWQKFAEHYSLGFGHFLVFRYQGNCRFQVLVFDKSASEIHYPHANDRDKGDIHQQEVRIEESEEDDSLQIIDSISKAKRRKKPECPRPRKMMKAGVSAVKGKAKRVNSDNDFNSGNPFFLAVMQPTCVARLNCCLSIPAEFSKKYLEDRGDVILSDSNGKTWSAKYGIYLRINTRLYLKLYSGWDAFVQDNDLQVGNVCVFELISRIEISFRVFIYGEKKADFQALRSFTDACLGPSKVHKTVIERTVKAREKALQSALANDKEKFHQHKRGKSDKKSKALERASSGFKSEHPFFLVFMQPAYVGRLNCKVCYLNIPKEFSMKYLTDHGDVILYDSNGKTWSSEYRSIPGMNKQPYARLISGWGAFVRDNNLKVGDVCAFELINRNDISFRVFIYASNKEDFHGPGTSKTTLQRTMKGLEKGLEIELANEEEKIHQQEVQIEETDKDDSIQIKNISKAVREKPVLQCPRPQKMLRSGRHYNGFSAGNVKVKIVNSVEKSKALERASSGFKSENPFFFVFMQPAYVGRLYSKVCYLSIPLDFSRKYLMDCGDIILSDSNGKTWSVEYRSLLGMNKQRYVRLCSGWGAFVRDNKLKVGDVCSFELINPNDISFRVFIYGSEKAAFHGSQISTDVFLGPLKVNETTIQRTMKTCGKALEIELAKEKEKFQQQEAEIEESEGDDSVEIINSISEAVSEKSVLQCPRPQKMLRSGRHNLGFSAGMGKVKRVNSVEKSKALERARSAFKSENPFFFALMQPTSVGLLKSNVVYLSIPIEFSRKYLMDRGNIILCDSNGKTWSAEYRSTLENNKKPYVRLGTGWGAFVRENNLQVGDVCAFELINRIEMSFRVFIYGSNKADFRGLGPLKVHETAHQRTMKAHENALQIELANEKQKFHRQEVEIEETEEDDTLQIKDKISQAMREKLVLQRPQPRKMMRTGRHNNGFSAGKGKLKRLKPYEISKALERARSAFKSENPFFLVLMQPSSVGLLNSGAYCCLNIPIEFSKKYLKRHSDVVLSDSNGKTWSAEYHTFLGTNKRPYVQLSKGWNAFVRDNNLQVGDVCVFELINRVDISFRVFIYDSKKADFHASRTSTDVCLEPLKVHETAPPRTVKSCEKGAQQDVEIYKTGPQRAMKASEKALERALAFTSENPYFLAVLGPSYIHSSQLVISNRFAREHFKSTLTKVDISLCLSNGKSWPVEYHQHTTGKLNARICNGWSTFVNDNKLKVGDVCVLEMTNDAQISFKVSIFRDIADEDCHPSQGVSQQPITLTSQSVFRRVVLPLHLKQKCVDIPFRFVEQYFKPNIEKLVLQVADRSWPVMVEIYPRSCVAKLTSGWIEFARENSLKEGDICVYEMDTVNNDVLKMMSSTNLCSMGDRTRTYEGNCTNLKKLCRQNPIEKANAFMMLLEKVTLRL